MHLLLDSKRFTCGLWKFDCDLGTCKPSSGLSWFCREDSQWVSSCVNTCVAWTGGPGPWPLSKKNRHHSQLQYAVHFIVTAINPWIRKIARLLNPVGIGVWLVRGAGPPAPAYWFPKAVFPAKGGLKLDICADGKGIGQQEMCSLCMSSFIPPLVEPNRILLHQVHISIVMHVIWLVPNPHSTLWRQQTVRMTKLLYICVWAARKKSSKCVFTAGCFSTAATAPLNPHGWTSSSNFIEP